MRVLVLTVVHVPEDARIRHRQIAALLDAGHEVTYAAPHDHDRAATRSTRASHATPGCDGLAHVVVPRATGRDRLGSLRAARRVLAELGPRHDIVLLHDPELLVALVGVRGLPPVVWDVHEDLAGSLADKDWLPDAVRGPLAGLVRAGERVAERRAHLLLAEHAYQDRFARLHPVVPNVPPLPDAPGVAATRDVVVHLGRVSRLRGAEELVAVGRGLATEGVLLHLVGPVDADVDGLVTDAAARGDLVRHGFVPNDRALGMLDGALAGLALLHDHPNYRVSLPTKVVEYQAAGIPVVTTPLPEAVRVVEASRGGVVVPFDDPDAVVAQVLAWRDDRDAARELGRRGRRAAEERWSWDAHAPAFVAQLERWAGAQGRRPRGVSRSARRGAGSPRRWR